MGKKSKPTVTKKLLDKANRRNFTLVFIKPTIKRATILVEQQQNDELIGSTLLQLTTQRFRKVQEQQKVVKEDDEEESDEETMLSSGSDDSSDDEDDDLLTPIPEEILVEQLRRLEPTGEQTDGGKNEIDVLSGQYQPRNLNDLLDILCKSLNLVKWDREKIFFKSDYFLKYVSYVQGGPKVSRLDNFNWT